MRPSIILCTSTLLLIDRPVCLAQDCDLHDLTEAGHFNAKAVGLTDGSFVLAGRVETGDLVGDLVAPSSGGFVARRYADGSWEWLQLITADDFVSIGGLTVDEGAGTMFVSGKTWSSTVSFNGVPQDVPGDVFVARLNMNGNFEWMTRADTNGNNIPLDVVSDGEGGVYVHGWNNPEEFQAHFGPFTFQTGSANDVYFAHLRSDGTWDWVKYIVGQPEIISSDLTLDTLDRPVLVGYFTGLSMAIAEDTLYANQVSEFPITFFAACFTPTGELVWAITPDSSIVAGSNIGVVMAPEGRPLRVFGKGEPGLVLEGLTFDEGGNFIAGLDYTGHWTYLSPLAMVGGVMSAAQLPENLLLVGGGCMTPGSIGPLEVQIGSAMQVGFAGICDDAGHWFAADQTFGSYITEMHVATIPGEWRAVGYGSFQQQLWLDGDTLDDGFASSDGYICDIGFGTVGLPEIDPATKLNVWPVPAQDRLYFTVPVQRGATHLRVIDAAGRVLIDRMSAAGHVDVSHLSPGCYMVLANGASARFVKE